MERGPRLDCALSLTSVHSVSSVDTTLDGRRAAPRHVINQGVALHGCANYCRSARRLLCGLGRHLNSPTPSPPPGQVQVIWTQRLAFGFRGLKYPPLLERGGLAANG